MLVKFGRELVYQNEVGKDDQTLTSRDKQTMINSELAIVHSRPVLQQVAHNVGLDKLYPDLAEAAAEVKSDGKVADDDPARDGVLLAGGGAARGSRSRRRRFRMPTCSASRSSTPIPRSPRPPSQSS